MRAIKCRFIRQTGTRLIGDADLKGTYCDPTWQNLETCEEVRLIVKGDPDRFNGIDGVEVLDGEEAIDAAIAALQPEPEPMIFNEALMIESVRDKKLLRELGGKSAREQMRTLHRAGCAGVCCDECKPTPCSDIAAAERIKRPDKKLPGE